MLRDVALLRRDVEGSGAGGEATPLRSESEVALVTDARLYGEFPPQPAMGWASAGFDFGDSQAAVVHAAEEAAPAAAVGAAQNTAAAYADVADDYHRLLAGKTLGALITEGAAAALEGTLRLAASHPTNPFRHRRHPDHRVGFDVTRKLRLDFDGEAGGTLERAGYGVDRITGVYREEILGLHKPLGPGRDVGLRVEGKFRLQRLALIETLNAR